MDRFVPRRCRNILWLLLALSLLPSGAGRAMRPNLSDEPAGDPGDGVLRPADSSGGSGSSQAAASATEPAAASTQASATFLLVPCWAPPGQPWPLTFQLIRVGPGADSQTVAGRPSMFRGRWHRAP